jgi:hypothetical protein
MIVPPEKDQALRAFIAFAKKNFRNRRARKGAARVPPPTTKPRSANLPTVPRLKDQLASREQRSAAGSAPLLYVSSANRKSL